jgi:Holliday junction DNA helicase RuvA
MIGKLTGRLDHRGADHVLIDVGGVGYVVHVSDRTLAQLGAAGAEVALYTELLVREDLLQLYGFPTLIEKEWHRLLISVQGIGAKAALAILGTLGPEALARAIALGDARAIQSAPGVGPKLAQRVAMELKSKAPAAMAAAGALSAPAQAAATPAGATAAGTPAPRPRRAAPSDAAPTDGQRRARYTADALSALVNLGYAGGDAAQAVATASAEAPEADTAALIRLSLRILAPR